MQPEILEILERLLEPSLDVNIWNFGCKDVCYLGYGLTDLYEVEHGLEEHIDYSGFF